MRLQDLLALICSFLLPLGHRTSNLLPYIKDETFDAGLRGAYPIRDYVSFDQFSPRVNILQWHESCDDGRYVAMAPHGLAVPTRGPMLMRPDGELVWIDGSFGTAENVRVQMFQGERFLTFWAGEAGLYSWATGRGKYFMLNASYDVVRTLQPASGFYGDFHEFFITRENTALFTMYETIQVDDCWDFAQMGSCWILDSLFQEMDIVAGEVLFEWRASDHYSFDESLLPLDGRGYTEEAPWDFFHINSVDKDSKGNYIVSGRHVSSITCIAPDGETLWILGGKRNMFTDPYSGMAINFTGQHHATWHGNNILTLFDNGAINDQVAAEHSRGLQIFLDVDTKTVSILQEYSIANVLSTSQGSMQILPEHTNVFIGWGQHPGYTEFAIDGEIRCNVLYSPPSLTYFRLASSYRAFKVDWIGRPTKPPAMAMKSYDHDNVYVSWNGATEVAIWRLEGQRQSWFDECCWTEIATVPKWGFETRIALDLEYSMQYFRAVALDIQGNELGITEAIKNARARI